MRLDKWLWAARFFKTRALAVDEIERGRVRVNGADAKPSREVREGDELGIRQAGLERTFFVRALSQQRGPASVAQTLYEETAASLVRREQWLQERRQGVEPALAQTQGRPTKRDRRDIVRQTTKWERWSVSLDDLGEKP